MHNPTTIIHHDYNAGEDCPLVFFILTEEKRKVAEDTKNNFAPALRTNATVSGIKVFGNVPVSQ